MDEFKFPQTHCYLQLRFDMFLDFLTSEETKLDFRFQHSI